MARRRCAEPCHHGSSSPRSPPCPGPPSANWAPRLDDLAQQQWRARAWDGSLVRKVPTAQALVEELAATADRLLLAPRLGLPTCAHLVPFQCRIRVLGPLPCAKKPTAQAFWVEVAVTAARTLLFALPP